MYQSPHNRPLAIYIHLPWCVRRCPYCDFNAHALTGELPRGPYLAALLDDLVRSVALTGEREVSSVFFGGGTPSLFPAADIAAVIEKIRALLPMSDSAEITLEANPGTMEHDRFLAYRDAGITRLSLGIQSLEPAALEVLGRIHGPDEAERAMSDASAVFDRWNADLMHGLPGQTVGSAMGDVERVLGYGPRHVSYYQLTIEPNTPFHHRPPTLPDADACWDIQAACHARLAQENLANYEISAWAVPGEECRHNLHYWTWGDFLGLGAGAHGKLTSAEGTVTKTEQPRNPNLYVKGAGERRSHTLTAADVLFEFMLNRLRLRHSLGTEELAAGLGASEPLARSRLDRAVDDGLLSFDGEAWRHTERGWCFLNDLQERFLPEHTP
jgi:putative oxygen-independent coproporphyrinogen III oxidase